MDQFSLFGKPAEYWLELQKRIDETPNAERYLMEIIDLRSRVAFYESRIKEMATVMERRAL